jgi:hypothetical protein
MATNPSFDSLWRDCAACGSASTTLEFDGLLRREKCIRCETCGELTWGKEE